MAKPNKTNKKLSEIEIKTIEVTEMMAKLAKAAYVKCYGADKFSEWSLACQEQVANFVLAGVVLQAKQWEVATKCRECDKPDGPRQILSGGGRGSAKSHGILAQIFCDDCQRIKGLKVLCLRKVGRANKEQIQDFRKKLLGNLEHNYREQAQTIEFKNGSIVILGNFKDEKDIDKYLGLEYDLIYIMESNQLTQSKKINILSCLRTNKTNWRPRCYQDTNPGGIDHVANKNLFVEPWKAKKETETRYIHSNVDDNQFVDSGYKEYLEKLVGWQREAWLNGSWEFMAGAFFSNFHPDIHVYPNAQTQFNPRSITRWFAGLDYGYSHPNAFVLGCEDENGNIFIPAIYYASSTLIEEHAANIKDLISLYQLDISDLEFIAAGKDCFRVDKDGSTVATEYGERGIMLTPVHIDRINAWSQVAEVFGDIAHQIKPRCFIHQNCEQLVIQIQSAQSDPKKPNDILKMNADPETHEGGDDVLEACFVAETMIVCNGKEIPIESVKVGDKVLTREGWKKVLTAGKTGNKKVFEAQFSHGRNLIGTGNHPIFTQRGWVRLDALRNDDIVSICLNPKQLYLTEENSGVIHNQSEPLTEGITSQAESNHLVKAFRFIKKFTNTITRLIKSMPVSIYITETETRWIIGLKIWSASLEAFTYRNTAKSSQSKPKEQEWKWPDSLRLNGIIQRKPATLQNEDTQTVLANLFQTRNSNVNFAEKNLRSGHLTSSLNSVTSIARSRNKEEIHRTLKKESASFAKKSFQPTNTKQAKPELALANVEGVFAVGQRVVFNLEVEDCPEYFAKGVLVHNCRNLIVMCYSSLLTDAKPIQMGAYKSLSESDNEMEVIDVESEMIRCEELDMETMRAIG